MKNIIILTACVIGLGLTQSCGKNVHHKHKTKVVKGDTEVVEKEVEVHQAFEGNFYLSNNSFIELFQSGDSVLISSSYQLLTTVNPVNNTFAELPRISGEYVLQDNKLRISKNLNYTPGQDVEDDTNGNNITGQRRTDITVELVDDKLQITYEIYSDKIGNNANFIVATRVALEE